MNGTLREPPEIAVATQVHSARTRDGRHQMTSDTHPVPIASETGTPFCSAKARIPRHWWYRGAIQLIAAVLWYQEGAPLVATVY